jgi:UDP-glucose 4-epimerase
MTRLHWVVGAGGLLGSSVERDLRKRGEAVFEGPRIAWGQSSAVPQLADALSRFLTASEDDAWTIYWCAGAATTASRPEALAGEIATVGAFLDELKSHPAKTLARGAIFLASSAGAVYGGSTGAPFTELSSPVPLGSYGSAKMEAEECFRRFVEQTGVGVLVGRIANLYGPGQSLSKPQGLISRLCLTTLTRTPLSVFVPMDTLRDYLYVDDCAALVTAGMQRTHQDAGTRYHMKVLASGRSVSIIELLHQFRLVAKSRPYVVLGQSTESMLQSRDLRLASVYWTDLDDDPKVGLLEGISRTLKDVRFAFALPRAN